MVGQSFRGGAIGNYSDRRPAGTHTQNNPNILTRASTFSQFGRLGQLQFGAKRLYSCLPFFMIFFKNGTYLSYFWYVTAKESIAKLDPVGSTVRYEMRKLCTGSV